MFRNVKYGIGSKVNIMYVPENSPAVFVDPKLGLIHQIPSLDPRMTFYIPIGPQPLSFAAQEVSVKS